jgi:hypothetical protein
MSIVVPMSPIDRQIVTINMPCVIHMSSSIRIPIDKLRVDPRQLRGGGDIGVEVREEARDAGCAVDTVFDHGFDAGFGVGGGEGGGTAVLHQAAGGSFGAIDGDVAAGLAGVS